MLLKRTMKKLLSRAQKQAKEDSCLDFPKCSEWGKAARLNGCKKIAEEVLALEPEMADLTDEELKAKTDDLRSASPMVKLLMTYSTKPSQ